MYKLFCWVLHHLPEWKLACRWAESYHQLQHCLNVRIRLVCLGDLQYLVSLSMEWPKSHHFPRAARTNLKARQDPINPWEGRGTRCSACVAAPPPHGSKKGSTARRAMRTHFGQFWPGPAGTQVFRAGQRDRHRMNKQLHAWTATKPKAMFEPFEPATGANNPARHPLTIQSHLRTQGVFCHCRAEEKARPQATCGSQSMIARRLQERDPVLQDMVVDVTAPASPPGTPMGPAAGRDVRAW